MSDYLDEMRDSRDVPPVLKIQIITTLSTTSNKKIFIFEGDEDLSMYESWIINKCGNDNWTHICGTGKKQLVSLYKKLISDKDKEILPHCYFFIDQDYDLETINDKHILTLNSYSAENYIICRQSISSILRDEFKLNGEKTQLYNQIIQKYEKDFLSFKLLAKELCKPLFVLHHEQGKVTHYKKISQLIHIDIDNIRFHENYHTKLIEYNVNSPYAERFDNLSYALAIKGKYIYEFAKLWLKKLKEKLKEEFPEIGKTKDPQTLELRRFACMAPIPEELETFLSSI